MDIYDDFCPGLAVTILENIEHNDSYDCRFPTNVPYKFQNNFIGYPIIIKVIQLPFISCFVLTFDLNRNSWQSQPLIIDIRRVKLRKLSIEYVKSFPGYESL